MGGEVGGRWSGSVRLRAARLRQFEERSGSGVDPAWGWGSPRVWTRGRFRWSGVLPEPSSRRTSGSTGPRPRGTRAGVPPESSSREELVREERVREERAVSIRAGRSELRPACQVR